MTFDTIILGAGPAGIGAAIRLGKRAIVLERSSQVAGLCRTIVLDGALFDLGGHSFHTPHPAVRRLVFDALPMETQRRNAWCLVDGSWIAYPFQQHFTELPDKALRETCARDLAGAKDGRAAANFDSYLDLRFGPGIARAFMRPYNTKLWGKDLARMSVDWTAERIATPNSNERLSAQDEGVRLPLQAGTEIAYPASGGYDEIFRALSSQIADLRMGQEVVQIDPRRGTLLTSLGETLRWRQIVSTLPLPILLATLPNVPDEISSSVAALEALPISLVMVVLEGRGQVERQRIYCSGDELPGHKVVFNNTSSTWLRKQLRHGILVEVAGGRQHDAADLTQSTISGLTKTGLIGRASEVRRVEVLQIPLGYPVPTHARTGVIRNVRNWLGEHGIVLAGRFAEWAYINADEALFRGMSIGSPLAEAG